MQMFDESIWSRIPKNRLDMVNDLDIPEDVTLTPYTWNDLDDSLTVQADRSLIESASVSFDECDVRTASSDSSLALSRAMTDSEIDYDWYRRLKNRAFSDPWDQMRAAQDAFSPGYIDSLHRFYTPSVEEVCTDTVPATLTATERILRENRLLRLKMRAFFNEECTVFQPDDPGLVELKDALDSLDMKKLEWELDNLPVYPFY